MLAGAGIALGSVELTTCLLTIAFLYSFLSKIGMQDWCPRVGRQVFSVLLASTWLYSWTQSECPFLAKLFLIHLISFCSEEG